MSTQVDASDVIRIAAPLDPILADESVFREADAGPIPLATHHPAGDE